MKKYIFVFLIYIIALMSITNVYADATVPESKIHFVYYYRSGSNGFEQESNYYLDTDNEESYIPIGMTHITLAGYTGFIDNITFTKGTTYRINVPLVFMGGEDCLNDLSGFESLVSVYPRICSGNSCSTNWDGSAVSYSDVQVTNIGDWVYLYFEVTPSSTVQGFRFSFGNLGSDRVYGFRSCAKAIAFGTLNVSYAAKVDSSGPIGNSDIYHQQEETNSWLESIIENDKKQHEELRKDNAAMQKKLEDIEKNLTDSGTSGANSTAGGFFEGFESNDFGLTSVITSPLNLIKSLANSTCTPLELPLPFVDQSVILPCMYTIYETYFGGFLQIYQTITFGMVAYWVSVQIFRMVQGFKDPNSDKVEVLDL